MKKIFIQFGKRILKHRKKLVYGVFSLFVFQICFFGLGGVGVENEVFADGNTVTQNDLFQQKTTEWYEELAFLNKVVYVLVYPLLLLAGKLVDNSFVYGEIFGFDAVLWQLWNIIKNLANYTLGFLLVYKIFEGLLVKKQGQGKVKDLLISALIAGVGIQASRFIIASLIDISTILAYSVGGLPISILKDKSSFDSIAYNPYILKNVVEADAEDIDTVHMYLTNTQTGDKKPGEFYISQCETFSYKYGGMSEELILAPRMIYYIEKQGNTQEIKQTDKDRCHFYGQVYYFGGLYGDLKEKFVKCSNEKECKDAQNAYKEALDTSKTQIIKSDTGQVVGLIRNVQILQIGDAHTTGGVVGGLGPVIYTEDKQGLDLYNKWTGSGGTTSRLENILDGNSYVGVFTALYSSLLNSGRGIIPPDAGTFAALLNVALSLGYVLAIGIPLIAVSLIFIMRVGILRMAVALSPFIVLGAAFKSLGDKIFKKGKFMEYFTPKNLIMIILSPAIICFAISISAVLVAIISELNFNGIITAKTGILGGLIELDIGGLSIGIGKFIISVFGIAITWFLVWAAIETSKLGNSKFIQNVRNLATTALGSIPIVPVVGMDADGKLKADLIGTNSAFGEDGIISTLGTKVKNKFNGDGTWRDLIDPDNAKKRRADAYKDAIVNYTPTTTSWTTEEITLRSEDGKGYSSTFVDLLGTEKEGIIAAINGITDVGKREAFGNREPTITFDNGEKEVTYQFNKNGDKKYDLV